MEIKKRDGSLEAFMPEKVVVSIVKSGAPYEEARSIAESLSKRSESTMESSMLRDHIHSELKSRGFTSAVEEWNKYEQSKRSSTS